MKKVVLFVCIGCLCLFTTTVKGEGSETFERITKDYLAVTNFTYTGDNNATWQIIGTTNYAITGFRAATLFAYDVLGNGITGAFSTIQLEQGVGVVSFKVKAAYASSAACWGNRSFLVTVGNVSKTVTVSIPNATTIATASAEINLSPADLSASTQLKIQLVGVVNGEPGYCVDDISWTSYSGKTDTPTITVDAYQDANNQVYYGTNIKAYFASTTPDATFYYTLDGTNPTQTSLVYDNAGVSLSMGTTTVKILAVTVAKGESEVATYEVTTETGLIYANPCTTIKPNLWENIGSISLTNTITKGTTASGIPFLNLTSQQGASVQTEAYIHPKAFSTYVGTTTTTDVTVYYQLGTYEVSSGQYTWKNEGDWVSLCTFRRGASNMKRHDLEIPNAIKNQLARFKIYSSSSVYLDDITIVTESVEQVSLPTYSQSGGDVNKGTIITITCPTGATLFYSVNGATIQTSNSNVQITINDKTELMAYATADGKQQSFVAKETYILPTTKTPTITPSNGTQLLLNDTITIASATDNATIVYCINNGEFQTQVTPVKVPVKENITSLWAYSKCTGLLDSDTVRMTYTTAKVGTPKVDITDEFVSVGTNVLLYSATDYAMLHYQINGGVWETASGSKQLTIADACTIKAYASKANYISSDTLTVTYKIKTPTNTVDFEQDVYEVYANDGTLYMITPAASDLIVYSIGGEILYVGKVTVGLNTLTWLNKNRIIIVSMAGKSYKVIVH